MVSSVNGLSLYLFGIYLILQICTPNIMYVRGLEAFSCHLGHSLNSDPISHSTRVMHVVCLSQQLDRDNTADQQDSQHHRPDLQVLLQVGPNLGAEDADDQSYHEETKAAAND